MGLRRYVFSVVAGGIAVGLVALLEEFRWAALAGSLAGIFLVLLWRELPEDACPMCWNGTQRGGTFHESGHERCEQELYWREDPSREGHVARAKAEGRALLWGRAYVERLYFAGRRAREAAREGGP